MKNNLIKSIGLIGIILILIFAVGSIGALIFSGIKGFGGRESLLSAFGGAFFAYIFVKIGELFTRLSTREKLNLDTIVEIEYTLNDHLNRIGTNINIVEALKTLIEQKSNAINFMKAKPIPIDKTNLRNMKNLDFINDMFNYFVDLDKVNEGLELILNFAIKMINDNNEMKLSGLPTSNIEKAYELNSEALVGMANDTISLMKAAETDCVSLIAKSKYVYDHRNLWLSLAYSGGKQGHYGTDLKTELPMLIKDIEASRDVNTNTSLKKTAKALSKDK